MKMKNLQTFLEQQALSTRTIYEWGNLHYHDCSKATKAELELTRDFYAVQMSAVSALLPAERKSICKAINAHCMVPFKLWSLRDLVSAMRGKVPLIYQEERGNLPFVHRKAEASIRKRLTVNVQFLSYEDALLVRESFQLRQFFRVAEEIIQRLKPKQQPRVKLIIADEDKIKVPQKEGGEIEEEEFAVYAKPTDQITVSYSNTTAIPVLGVNVNYAVPQPLIPSMMPLPLDSASYIKSADTSGKFEGLYYAAGLLYSVMPQLSMSMLTATLPCEGSTAISFWYGNRRSTRMSGEALNIYLMRTKEIFTMSSLNCNRVWKEEEMKEFPRFTGEAFLYWSKAHVERRFTRPLQLVFPSFTFAQSQDVIMAEVVDVGKRVDGTNYAEDERKRINRERNQEKIQRKKEANHEMYLRRVEAIGLKGPSLTITPKAGAYSLVLESLLAMKKAGVISDVASIVAQMVGNLVCGTNTKEFRSDAHPYLEGWTKTEKKVEWQESMQIILNGPNTIAAEKLSHGPSTIYSFTLTMRGFVPAHTRAPKGVALYFAIKKKDEGIRARLTHTVPAVHSNLYDVGTFSKVVGFNPEPVISRAYPHGMDLEQFTVYRITEADIPKSKKKHLLWFSFYDEDGFLGTRSFTFGEDVPQRVSHASSALAAADPLGINLLGAFIPWKDFLAKVFYARMSDSGRTVLAGSDAVLRI